MSPARKKSAGLWVAGGSWANRQHYYQIRPFRAGKMSCFCKIPEDLARLVTKPPLPEAGLLICGRRSEESLSSRTRANEFETRYLVSYRGTEFLNGLLGQPRVRTVAEGLVGRVFARAPRHRLGLGDFHLLRHKAGAAVRAVAKRLALRPPACAPEIGARLDFLHDRSLLENHGFAHKFFLCLEFKLQLVPVSWQGKWRGMEVL